MKNKIKLVISDIDGTLVSEERDALPSKTTVFAVKKLHQKGVILCLATGRALHFVENILL